MQQFQKVLGKHSGGLKFQQQQGGHLIPQPPLAPSLLTLSLALTLSPHYPTPTIADSDRSVPAELGLDTQASSCLRKGINPSEKHGASFALDMFVLRINCIDRNILAHILNSE